MNKVAFLGPIISKSNRFTSFLMPDLDSTAKNNSKISDLNLVGVLSLNFCPSQSLLPCCNLVLTWYPPKIEIAKRQKIVSSTSKLKLSRSSYFIKNSYHTKQEENLRMCTAQVSQVEIK